MTQANPNGFTTIGGGCAEKSDINPVQAIQAMHLRNNSYDSSGSGPRLRTKDVPKRRVGFELAIEQDSASSKTLSQLQACSDGSSSENNPMCHEDQRLSDIYQFDGFQSGKLRVSERILKDHSSSEEQQYPHRTMTEPQSSLQQYRRFHQDCKLDSIKEKSKELASPVTREYQEAATQTDVSHTFDNINVSSFKGSKRNEALEGDNECLQLNGR